MYNNSIYSEAKLPVSGPSRHLGVRLLSGRRFVLLNYSYLFLKNALCLASFVMVEYCVTTSMLEWQTKICTLLSTKIHRSEIF